jgi:hypothetical protein
VSDPFAFTKADARISFLLCTEFSQSDTTASINIPQPAIVRLTGEKLAHTDSTASLSQPTILFAARIRQFRVFTTRFSPK